MVKTLDRLWSTEERGVEDIKILKHALPYIKRYRDSTFVIKLGGELLTDEARLDSICADLSLLYELNMNLVIIHGGGPQADDLAKELGITPEKINGRRITDDRMLKVAKMVFAGQLSTDILAHLRRHSCPAVGLSGVDGDLIHARKRPIREEIDKDTGQPRAVDYGFVGDIVSVNTRVIEVLLQNRLVPVIASLGADADGEVLNINADTIACEVAAKLKARKLFFLTNVAGLLRDVQDPESRYSYITVEQGREIIASKSVTGGMMPKLKSALDAVSSGVSRAYIINGMAENSLLYEVFTRTGHGTMILSKEAEASYLDEG